MFDIHQESLKQHLLTISNRIPITILDEYQQQKVVYLTNANQSFWSLLNGISIKLFPSKTIQILKINNLSVQSKESYQEEKKLYNSIKKQELIKEKYKYYKSYGNC